MVDFPQAITVFQTWAGTQWEAFQIPPSDIERSTTNNFIYTGLNSNRFLALYKGVGPCAASIVMVVCHPVTGLFKGVIMGLQGNLRNGLWEVGAGIINSTRSCFNAAAVGTTATVGLLPFFNSIMYKAMTFSPTTAQLKRREIDQLTSQKNNLTTQVDDLTKAKNSIDNLLKGGALYMENILNPILDDSNGSVVKLKKQVDDANLSLKNLLDEITAIKDPNYKDLQQQLQAANDKATQSAQAKTEAETKIQELKQQLQAANDKATQSAQAKTEAETKIQELKQQLQAANDKATQSAQAKTEAETKIQELTQQLQTANDKTIQSAQAKTDVETKIQELTQQLQAANDKATQSAQAKTEAETKIQELKQQLQAANDKATQSAQAKTEAETKIQELKQQLQAANDKATQSAQAKTEAETKIQELKQQLQTANDKTIQSAQAKTDVETKIQELTQQLQAANDKATQSAQAKTEAETKIQELTQQLQAANDKVIQSAQVNEEIQALSNLQLLTISELKKYKKEMEDGLLLLKQTKVEDLNKEFKNQLPVELHSLLDCLIENQLTY